MPNGRRAPGKVSLYGGKTPVKFNIPQAVESFNS
jgi:hypothetical protein